MENSFERAGYVNEPFNYSAYLLLTMSLRWFLTAARKMLLAMLCVGVVQFAVPASAGSQPGRDSASVSTPIATHDHHTHTHDSQLPDVGHAEQHNGNHSHDIPSATTFLAYGGAPSIAERLFPIVLGITSMKPLPLDRPPDLLT